MNDIPYTTGRNSKKYLPVSVTRWWLQIQTISLEMSEYCVSEQITSQTDNFIWTV